MPPAADLAALQAAVLPLLLTLPRLLALFLVLPHFAGNMVNGLVRNAVVLVLAAFVAPMVGGDLPAGPGAWILMAAKEALIGLLLGLGFGVFIWAMQSVGDLIDAQTGSANAAFFDPTGGHEHGRTGDFIGRLTITLFVSAGGLLTMLGAVIESFQWWPVVSHYPDAGVVLQSFALRAGDTLLGWIVKLAAPVIFVLLLVELGIGLVGRAAPQLNVFQVAQPIKNLLAYLMLALMMNMVYVALQDFMRPENAVIRFMRGTL